MNEFALEVPEEMQEVLKDEENGNAFENYRKNIVFLELQFWRNKCQKKI